MTASDNSSKPGRANVPALRRGMELLEFISRNPHGVELADMRESCGIPIASLTRLLSELASCGYVMKSGRGIYHLTSRAFQVGTRGMGMEALLAAARPVLMRLAAESEETAELVTLDGPALLWLDCVDSPRSIRLSARRGWRTLGVQFHGNGRAILSVLPDELVREVLRQQEEASELTADVRKALDDARTAGYAFDEGLRRPEVTRVASPLPSGSWISPLAVGVAGPRFRIEAGSIGRMGQMCIRASKELAGALGTDT
ncbi:MAG: helix-turn-helix domain-containing protein [Planctomycetes bacterium]|nr:helix-turn-helix domain-containing protein [Planctomycetota bacterium]